MKQRMPKKPIRDGVKAWHKCYAETGFAYDFNIYEGAEERAVEGILVDIVVNILCRTTRSLNVVKVNRSTNFQIISKNSTKGVQWEKSCVK